jgi:hypothetical protein
MDKININMAPFNAKVEQAAAITSQIGILAEEKHNEDSFTTAGLGMVHEFGSISGKIPKRSFFALTEKQKQAEFQKFLKKNNDALVRHVLAGTWEIALEQLAAKWESYIIECFDTEGFGTWEELEDSTVAARLRKGNDVDMQILQDTGALMRSITHKVG